MKSHSSEQEAISCSLVSIIIPALKVDIELRRCVDSIRIICPNTELCEVIIVVPKSQVKEATDFFPRERIVCESKPSIYGAMNDGIKSSSGDYLYFLGKDDIVLPSFRDAISIIENSGPTAIFCDVYWGESGRYSGKPSKWRIIWQNYCHQGIIYSRQVLERHGPYCNRMRVQADHFVNIKLFWDTFSFNQLKYLPKPIAWYSGDGFSSSTEDSVFWNLYPKILKKYVGLWAYCALSVYRKLKCY